MPNASEEKQPGVDEIPQPEAAEAPSSKKAKSRRKAQPATASDPESHTSAADTSGRRNSELTGDEQLALLHHHKRSYEDVEAAIEAAQEVVKTWKKRRKKACELATRECGADAVDDIKDLIALDTPEGEAALTAKIARQLRVVSLSGVPIGTQFSFDDLAASKADPYSEGKLAGIKGEAARPPHDPSSPSYKPWMDGWQDGQGVLASGFEKLKSLHGEEPETETGGEPADQAELEEAIAAADGMPGSPAPPIDTSDRPFGMPDEDAGGDGGAAARDPDEDGQRIPGDFGPMPEELRR